MDDISFRKSRFVLFPFCSIAASSSSTTQKLFHSPFFHITLVPHSVKPLRFFRKYQKLLRFVGTYQSRNVSSECFKTITVLRNVTKPLRFFGMYQNCYVSSELTKIVNYVSSESTKTVTLRRKVSKPLRFFGMFQNCYVSSACSKTVSFLRNVPKSLRFFRMDYLIVVLFDHIG